MKSVFSFFITRAFTGFSGREVSKGLFTIFYHILPHFQDFVKGILRVCQLVNLIKLIKLINQANEGHLLIYSRFGQANGGRLLVRARVLGVIASVRVRLGAIGSPARTD